MPRFSVNGGQIDYDDAGQGPALVLVPGFDFGVWSFNWQRSVLSEHLRVISYSQRGVDGSSDAPAGFTIADMVTDLVGLLDHLAVDRVVVLGYSMGGFVAQELAIRHPERVRGLILASTSIGAARAVQPAPSVINTMASAASGPSEADEPGADEALYFSDACRASRSELMAEYRRLRHMHARPSGNWMQRMAMAMAFDSSARLGEFRGPVLITTGDDDPIVPPQNAELLRERLQDAQLERYPGGRHLFNIEFADRFNEQTLGFVREHA